MYRQGNAQWGLWIEQGTERCPEPKRYYVFRNGLLAGDRKGYRYLKQAQAKYGELRKELGGGSLEPLGWAKLEDAEKDRVLAGVAQEELVARTELSWVDWRSRHQSAGRRRYRR